MFENCTPILKIVAGETYAISDILKVQNYFIGTIHHEIASRPFEQLSQVINKKNELPDGFTKEVLEKGISQYHYDSRKDILAIYKLNMKMRTVKPEEIRKDYEGYGEQVLCSTDYYRKMTDLSEEEILKNPKITKARFLGDPGVYTGTQRFDRASFTAYITEYPDPKDFDYMMETLDEILPKGEMMEQTYFHMSVMHRGMAGEQLHIANIKDVNIDEAFEKIRKTVKENKPNPDLFDMTHDEWEMFKFQEQMKKEEEMFGRRIDPNDDDFRY